MLLLTGGSGLLGKALQRALFQKSISFLAPNSKELDLRNANAVSAYFQQNAITKVLHAAAWTDVDGAERDPAAAHLLNVGATQNLIAQGVPIIHISTDYVFDGTATRPLAEDAPRSPINEYGRTKALAEEALEASNIDWWNVRTSWLYGPDGPNIIDWALQTEKPFQLANDQVGRPTYTPELAQWLVDHFILHEPPCGHYHAQGGGEAVSRAVMVQYALQCAGQDANKVIPTPSAAVKRLAIRPSYTVLQNTKLPQMKEWKIILTSYIQPSIHS